MLVKPTICLFHPNAFQGEIRMRPYLLSFALIFCSVWVMVQTATPAAAADKFNARNFFQEVLAHTQLIERKDSRRGEASAQKAADLLQTATANPDRIYQKLSDSEAFSLAEAISRLDSQFGDEQNSKPILAVWDSFLKHYPRSPHIDKVRWLRAKIAATPYEYEGRADAALQQIEAIELFIKKYPANHCLPEAKLELARAYRIAYETFRYGNGLSMAPNKRTQTTGRKYRDRASQLLQRLCDQSSDPIRSDACRAIKDLAGGQCVYMGPGSPNPNYPDHWAAPKAK
jgi:hypothetical protein